MRRTERSSSSTACRRSASSASCAAESDGRHPDAIVRPVAPVSVTIITLNEAANIEACLASVAWADERLVVDSGSTDDTVARARAAGARVIERDWPGYATQKNFAAEQAAYDWILSVVADAPAFDIASSTRAS